VVLVIGVIQAGLLLRTEKEFNQRSSRELEALGRSQAYVNEVLTGITTVKAAGAEQRIFQQWMNLFCGQLNTTIRRVYLSSVISTVIMLAESLTPLVTLWIGTMLVLNGTL